MYDIKVVETFYAFNQRFLNWISSSRNLFNVDEDIEDSAIECEELAESMRIALREFHAKLNHKNKKNNVICFQTERAKRAPYQGD